MENYMTAPLSELKTQLLEDGIIDAEEVVQLKERLYADGVIDLQDVEQMDAPDHERTSKQTDEDRRPRRDH